MATRDRLMMISRRRLLAGAGLLGGSLLVPTIAAADRIEEIGDLKPGDYTWHPERSPSGPVVVVVSLPDQLTFVYRNGIRIAVSTCSTGKPGHETPTGVFTILQKDRDHHSSLYNDASMPNTERLTWSGVCLHAGGLPGYPSSHGCVHLPLEFSALLFGITTLGTVVIIAGQHDQPADVASSGLVLSEVAAEEAEVAAAAARKDGSSVEKAIAFVVSGADRRIDVLEDGESVLTGNATIDTPDQPLGSYTYILNHDDAGDGKLQWHAIGYNRDSAQAHTAESTLFRIHGDSQVVDAMRQRMVPGAILVTTDLPLHPDARSGKDFVIMNTAAES